MEDYKWTVELEPTDDYEKAKNDLAKAMMSIQKLSPWQKKMLAEEILGAERAIDFGRLFYDYFR